MNKRFFSFVLSIIMLITVFAGTPVFAAKTSESKQLYVVPFKDNFTAIRETPNLNDKHPLQIMAYSRGEYCIYTGEDVTVKNDAGKTEKWYKVNTVFGQPGYVINWAGKVVSEKPTTTTTALITATNKATSTTKAVSTTKKTTSTTKAVSTTKKTTTSTTAKPTTTELFYLTSKSYTNIRSGKSTKTAKLGVVREKDVAVADKKEGNWYHLISLNGKEKLGWCQANLMKEIPSPTTTITTTASKPTTITTVKKLTTTKKPTTTTTKAQKASYLYFSLVKGDEPAVLSPMSIQDVKVMSDSEIKVQIAFDPNTNTLIIKKVG